MFNDPTTQFLLTKINLHRQRLRALRDDDQGGLSIEAAIIIGALVLAAITLGAFVATKLTEKTGQIK